ncbi:hypothetical protein [uncultured Roseibium sp.]|uniref:hypothetical protein n=1 Tax=uncultured Roseibium sp. TaxID=1936171 RepID=UPI002603BAF1|nr:hypothetical protein [uncultured Roseibium sp.]
MIITQAVKTSAQLEMEVCRAMFEKDPEMLIELVSQWLEANRLTLDEHYCVPPYLQDVLSGVERPCNYYPGRPAMVC